MALNSLFNLDPTKYSLGRSSGAFSRVGETKGGLTLAELMQGLTPPTAPTNAPTVNPLDESIKTLMQSFGPAKGALTGILNQIGTQYESNIVNNTPYQTYSHSMRVQGGSLFDPYYYYVPIYVQDPAVNAARTAFDPYRSTYTSKLPEYQAAAPTIDTYNQEVAAYKGVVDPYKAEVNAYNTERESRAANYNVSSLSPNLVRKERVATEGEQLGATDLYSDQLHNLMLDKVSAANYDPAQDQVSALFAGSTK